MNFEVRDLGEKKIINPILSNALLEISAFISDDERMLHNVFLNKPNTEIESFELAGPRSKIYFDPTKIRSAIVTCGGLCPGLNDVIRSIVLQSYYRYGNKDILGIRYGYNGLNPANNYEPIQLTPHDVKYIHMDGGTILGSSRGGTDDMNILLDTLEKLKINILYTIGGDGTLSGALDITNLAEKRGLELAVIGIPKTIDNDISHIQRSFGFETAFSKAVDAIASAHVEAEGAPNGIGLVKLMGRHSGFIAAHAALAMNDVNFVLVPEIPFKLEGPNSFFEHLEKRITKRGHAVICVAEGAGQNHLIKEGEKQDHDASHNVKLEDIGLFLKKHIKEYFKKKEIKVNLKYIDPSYIIRSAPACPNDSIFCALLGQHAVHAGMAGKTGILIGQWNNTYTHVPIELAISKRKIIDPSSLFWASVLEATGQPISML